MRDDGGRPAGVAVHATVVAIGGPGDPRRGMPTSGLLIRGASGAGKSALALALIAAGHARRVVLVGDDRVLLRRRRDGRVVARPHPRIAGFIERRGLGLVAMPWRGRAVLAGCVAIGAVPPAGEAERLLAGLPVLAIEGRREAGGEGVLAWWDGLADAADRTQVA